MLESYRPMFHFTTQKNWINDPNGLVFLNGQYHLFFQHNPIANTPGHIGWGHAVSTNLIDWTELPMALPFDGNVMAFSGSVVVDKYNSAGFGTNALIALFTAHHTTKRLETQHLAFSTDLGHSWTPYDHNPVLDLGKADFRDPKVFWHETTKRWVMLVVLPDEHKVLFYGSSNLKNWEYLSEFGPCGATNGIWEVPDMFALPLEGTEHWVLKVDIGSGALHGGSGGQYFVGQFNGTHFIADSLETCWLDYGKDFYAALSFANTDNRTVWLAWMNNWQYAQETPTSPWRGAMSIPRELGLCRVQDRIFLVQQPVPELEKLRTDTFQAQQFSLSATRALPISGQHLEIMVEFELLTATEFGIRFADITIGYNKATQAVFIDRPQPPLQGFAGRHSVILEQKVVQLHIFLDSCSIEIFVQQGQFVLTDLVFPTSHALEMYAENGTVQIKNLIIWELQ